MVRDPSNINWNIAAGASAIAGCALVLLQPQWWQGLLFFAFQAAVLLWLRPHGQSTAATLAEDDLAQTGNPVLRSDEWQALLVRVLPLWSAQLGVVQRQLGDTASSLVSNISALSARVAPAPETGIADALLSTSPAPASSHEPMMREINALLITLQFEDRANQIINAVRADMLRLQQACAAPDARSIDWDDWQHQLAATYTTREQRQTHVRATERDTETTDITFF